MLPASCNKTVLLTGAGLTKNWGGKLAAELWEDLIGHPALRADAGARSLLLEEVRFEAALANAQTGNYGPTAYTTLSAAVYDSFVSMDRQIAAATSSSTGVNPYGFQEFLRLFGRDRRHCFVFTVNQDLLVERKFYDHFPRCGLPHYPGLTGKPIAFQSNNLGWFAPNDGYWLAGEIGPRPYSDLDVIIPSGPMRLSWNDPNETFRYVKLHGSFTWRDTDRRLAMVMGDGKESQIQASGLFTAYHELFREVLCSGDVRLMTLGYGFGDGHINAAVAEAARHHGLTLHIWDTRPPRAMKEALNEVPDGPAIWQSLRGYDSGRLAELFPADQTRTERWAQLSKGFFDA